MDDLKENIKQSDYWVRLLTMVVYLIVFYAAQFVIWIITAAQFIFSICTGHINKNLMIFSKNLAMFCYQVLQYATYVSNKKPFPFSDWPKDQELKKEKASATPKARIKKPVPAKKRVKKPEAKVEK